MKKKDFKNKKWIKKNALKCKEKHTELFSKYAINTKTGIVYLKKDEEVKMHSTENGEEILIILSGKGSAFTEDRKIIIEKGDIVYFGPYTNHSIKADKESELCYVYVYSEIKKKNF